MDGLIEWLNAGNYLPKFMRDFHDQKKIFKHVHNQTGLDNPHTKDMAWSDAHVYTVDFFLWWMAKRGYTLQKTRKKNIKFMELP